MQFTCSGSEIKINIDTLFVAGWTGRNADAVQHHIDELAAIGITPPTQVPLYYRVSSGLLTQDTVVEVLGEGTSGEVEPLLIQWDGKIWIGLASDHTDRELEAHSVAASKQACMKPASQELWAYEEVEDELDDLMLRCSIKEDGEWISYQKGSLSNILPLAELMKSSGFGDGSAMLCGTLGAIGGVRPANDYRMELEDAKRNRRITLNYTVRTLPIVA
ncbi:DUF2848 domain-containing protein [uncultured Ruegeria sp.]|uniref:DUF2848 domain-containing protein n=1 Tax=uncultured Ruegeria sp. TaxID=259304 RepID=UPI002618A3FC|nr:DUF2848 domain-containing protein [uncultured Ruegeria sp.]